MVGFVVPLALALFTSLVVFQIVRTYNRSVANVTAASQASGDLNVLIKTVIDADETGQRGFAITGNEVFFRAVHLEHRKLRRGPLELARLPFRQ